MAKRRGLGRGLDALLGSVSEAGAEGGGPSEIPLNRLRPGQHQPRREFDGDALDALAQSIRTQGVVQPIVVRPAGEGRYEIVAGERRWRASKKAGLKTIPAVIRVLEDRAAMAVALVENIQRADLNALEEAEALKRLIDEYGLTHEQCSEAMGRSRAAVTNFLRLFELNNEVQALVRAGKVTFGHARALLGISGKAQTEVAKRVVADQLSVRQVEALARVAGKGRGHKTSRARAPARPAEQALSTRLGLPVRIQANADGGGRLTIQFRRKSELDKVLKLLR